MRIDITHDEKPMCRVRATMRSGRSITIHLLDEEDVIGASSTTRMHPLVVLAEDGSRLVHISLPPGEPAAVWP